MKEELIIGSGDSETRIHGELEKKDAEKISTFDKICSLWFPQIARLVTTLRKCRRPPYGETFVALFLPDRDHFCTKYASKLKWPKNGYTKLSQEANDRSSETRPSTRGVKEIQVRSKRTEHCDNHYNKRLHGWYGAQKEIDIKEGLKVKAHEISVVKEKHDELVKQSLLTKSHYEGLVKEKTKVITDLKLKEEKDIDKMISMENQIKFLNEIVYKRSQSIQTIHMLAPKCPTFNGRPTFANPRYLKKAQNEIPCLYAIPHDQSDPANRLVPDREETQTLEEESRSKLNKDLVKPFDYTKLNSLYEIFKPPTQHYEIQFAQANEIRKKMWRKSFVKTKPNIFKNIDFLPVSKSISKSRQAYNVMTNNINHLKEIVNQAWVKHSNDLLHLRNPTAQDMEILVKTCLMPLALKTQNDSFAFVHELKQEMHADLKYVESLEDELDELESDKAEFSNMYDMLLQECVSKDVMCSYLQSSSDLDEITELQCLYLHKVRECDCLAQKLSEQTEFLPILVLAYVTMINYGNSVMSSRKSEFPTEIYTKLLQSFSKLEKHSISLEIALQECQEQLKNDTVCKEKASNVFRKEREQYFEIQDLKAQLQDKNIAISELKKLIEKCKGKSVDTKFDKPSVVRQPNAQRIPKPSVLGKPAPFSDSLERKNFAKKKSISKTNESEGMYRIESSTTPTRTPQLTQTSRNTNPRVSTYTGVAHKTNVSRPQPRSNQMKDKSVTACNDSLNSRTSNVNAVCATCGKCVFNLNHDACVSKFLNDVNAKLRSLMMLYKKTSKAWKWWIAQQCPSAYKWVPKTKRKWVPKVRNESVNKKIVQLILFIVDSGCTKHMTGNLSLLCNFVEKYLGTVHFGNDQFALILGYGDLVQGNIMINRVYYVEGLNHNLFSVGQFCDADLEVAFQKSTCFVRDLQGNDLLTGNRGTDLYIISLQETTSSTPICLMAKASPTQAWLWHRRLSHLNFDYINLLSKKDVVIGLPKLKYVKNQLCSSCEVSKAKRSSFKSKTVPSSKGRLNLLHMDLCGPMRVASINGKKYILVIVDDYSRYTWTLFLRSKDETPEVLKDFLTMIQRNLQALVISVRTDRGTEFLNKTLNAFFKEEGIEHQTSTPRTPEQNGVVER
ncbi:retrovirus-related pol polyprotein from transposon TNT 1-94 [Tanacetum coccineum]|uniref:Retrovirus-related pol polyprotein from transposon TNT 1-94 n=1 Tax=Tanacetum coccineum TaxID=301880 RepID=A0ABQ5DJY8_9ASTR